MRAMKSRNIVITATVIAGLVCGPALLRLSPTNWPAVPSFSLLVVFLSCTFGVPVLLAVLGAGGNYKVMIRVWSLVGLLAILTVAMGLSAAAQSMAALGLAPGSIFLVVVGAGLFAGLGVVKLATRRARSGRSA